MAVTLRISYVHKFFLCLKLKVKDGTEPYTNICVYIFFLTLNLFKYKKCIITIYWFPSYIFSLFFIVQKYIYLFNINNNENMIWWINTENSFDIKINIILEFSWKSQNPDKNIARIAKRCPENISSVVEVSCCSY